MNFIVNKVKFIKFKKVNIEGILLRISIGHDNDNIDWSSDDNSESE